MKTVFYTLTLIIGIVLSGCSASYIYKLKADSDKVDYYKGEELMAREDSLLFTQVGFLDDNKDEYRFFINLINYSPASFVFNPTEMYLRDFSRDSLGNISEGKNKIRATDPEKQLTNLDASKEAGEKLHTVLSAVNIITGVFSVAAEVESKDHHNKSTHIADAVINTIANQAELNSGLEENKNAIDAEKNRWEFDVLHTTTVAPGDTVSGYVVFPKGDEKSNLFLALQLAGTEHKYYFRRVKLPK